MRRTDEATVCRECENPLVFIAMRAVVVGGVFKQSNRHRPTEYCTGTHYIKIERSPLSSLLCLWNSITRHSTINNKIHKKREK